MDGGIEVTNAEVLARSPPYSGDEGLTRESIDPRVSLNVVEIDPQSSQFACELTIANVSDDEFEVLIVRPRFPKGIRLEESVDLAEIALNERHGELCGILSRNLTNAAILSSPDMSKKYIERFRDFAKAALTVKSILDIYISIILWKQPEIFIEARRHEIKVEVTSAADAEEALKFFPVDASSVEHKLINYNLALIKALELEDGFEASRKRSITLKRGQQYKTVYIVNARRGAFSPTSFSFSVDMLFKRADYKVSRMESATVKVPPGPLWLTIIAMFSAAIGSYLQIYTPSRSAPAAGAGAQHQILENYLFEIGPRLPGALIHTLGVPILTAIIFYNIFDMTTMKKQFSMARNWRSAIFIGFVCGFLNKKILDAFAALLG